MEQHEHFTAAFKPKQWLPSVGHTTSNTHVCVCSGYVIYSGVVTDSMFV